MRNIKLTLSYDGSGFSGWQVQPYQRTIQGAVEDALGIILNEKTRLYGAGRTDAGVHALGQVANLRTENRIDCVGLHRGLNALLPADVRIIDVRDAEEDFDARRSARSRLYMYFIVTADIMSPFGRNYAWHVRNCLDISAMQRAGGFLLGAHDFASFCGSGSDPEGTVREVIELSISKPHGCVIEFSIEANAFLRHMVRNIVGTLALVGRGKLDSDEMLGILDAKNRSSAGETAPPWGLYLKEVKYL